MNKKEAIMIVIVFVVSTGILFTMQVSMMNSTETESLRIQLKDLEQNYGFCMDTLKDVMPDRPDMIKDVVVGLRI